MKISKKVKLVVWQVVHIRVNTLDRLSARGALLVASGCIVIFIVGRQLRTLIIFFRVVIFLGPFGMVSLSCFTTYSLHIL